MKNMILDQVPRQFCEGPFWGNGRMGTVLYIRDRELYFSVDHTTLWELREDLPDEPKADFSEILKHRQEYLQGDSRYVERTDIFGKNLGRTKLPALGVSMALPDEVKQFRSETDMEKAVTKLTIGLENGTSIAGVLWMDSCCNVFHVDISGDGAENIYPEAKGWDLESERLQVLKNWNYEPCSQETEPGRFCMKQRFGGDRLAVLNGKELRSAGNLKFMVTIRTGTKDQEEALAEQGKAELEAYLDKQEQHFREHLADWASFWAKSRIEVPNERLQEAYEQEMYKIYCNERADSSPVTLQGVWNPNNRMPAWFGDLHNDLNVQSCYWAAYKTGNVELVRPYVDYYAAAIPRFQERAGKLFHIPGAIHVPTMMAPDGTGAASEWCYWNTILGPELFVATDFCWFYEYSQDQEALRDKIVPFLEGVVKLYQGIAYEGEDGYLHIPFTTSPEVSDENGMLMRDDATFTLSVLHYVLKHLKKYGEILHMDTTVWEEFDERLAPVVLTEKGLPLFKGVDVFESHRHFCQLFPIYPLGEEGHNELANRSLDTAINQGFTEFAAFSFPYLGIMASRCGRGNMARTMLEIYCMVFRSRNSFTVNGDPYQNGVLKISDTNAGESADSFTLESGFFIPAAMCEMFVHRCQDRIWLLSGIPNEWKSCRCQNLVTEGGHKVSVSRENYGISAAELTAGCTEVLEICWNEEKPAKEILLNGRKPDGDFGDRIRVSMEKGDRLEIIW